MQRSEEIVRDARNLARTMLLIPVTMAACRLGLHAWGHWCIIIVILFSHPVCMQDLETTPVPEPIPPQVEKGMDMTHETYKFSAFDCDTPEDVVTQSIPRGCSVEQSPTDTHRDDSSPRQEYTVLQRVASFEYNATLCTVRRSRNYYDCVWASHVRIAIPPIIYQQVTLEVYECNRMAVQGEFYDSVRYTSPTGSTKRS